MKVIFFQNIKRGAVLILALIFLFMAITNATLELRLDYTLYKEGLQAFMQTEVSSHLGCDAEKVVMDSSSYTV
jgi:hypothetical protein